MKNGELRTGDGERHFVRRIDDRPVTVYKIGGSLFDLPELLPRLTEFFKHEPTRPLIVSGGGGAADVVREWDRVHRLGDVRSHRLAIVSLSLGSAFLAEGLCARLVSDRKGAAAAWSAQQLAVLDAAAFLEREAAAGATPLPSSWDVTSDSIAAWIAARWPARLTLVKSASPVHLAGDYVDPYFARASATLDRVEWVNLRDDERGPLAIDVPAALRQHLLRERAGT